MSWTCINAFAARARLLHIIRHHMAFHTKSFLRVLLPTLVAYAIVGCGGGDGGVAPPPTVANVAVTGDQQQGAVGAKLSVPLTVRATSASGAPIAGVSVTWTVTSGNGSVLPASSTTSSDGVAQTEWTLGSGTGGQSVTAMVGAVTKTFTATAAVAPDCGATVDLQVGALCLAQPSRAVQFDVNGGASGGEFTAIAFYDGSSTRGGDSLRAPALSVSATASGVVTVTGPPSPTRIVTSLAGLGGIANNRTADFAFETRFRLKERRELEPLVRGRARLFGGLTLRTAFAPAAPLNAVVGEKISLNVNSSQPCSNAILRDMIVRTISTNAIILEDPTNPSGGFTQADYDKIGTDFDNLVYSLNVATFGAPTDIDNNGKVLILFTAEVNKLTPANSSTSFVAGFFYARDLFPKTGKTTPSGQQLGACAASNVAEMFYLLAPDPNSTFGNKWTVDQVKRITLSTTVHEMQHLINSARRLYINTGAVWPETVWMEEGLAHIAEELLFYRASGLAPRSNIDATVIRSSQEILDAFNFYGISNMGRLSSYLKTPENQSPYGEKPDFDDDPDDDLQTRGSIWEFLRYAADQRGSGDGDAWNRLVNNKLTGFENLRDVFGNALGETLRNWAAANYIDDAVGAAPTVFTHPSWNYRSVLAALTSNASRYPLKTTPLLDTPYNFPLVDGGASYLRFGVPVGGKSTVRITMAGGALPAGASVWLVRTK